MFDFNTFAALYSYVLKRKKEVIYSFLSFISINVSEPQ